MEIKELENFVKEVRNIHKNDIVIMIEDKGNNLDDVCDDIISECVNGFIEELESQLEGYLEELKENG